MIKISALFKLLEPAPAYLPGDSPASFAHPTYRELTLRCFDIRLDTGGKIYELSNSNAPDDDGFRSRGLAFARQVVPLTPDSPEDESAPPRRSDMSVEQQIVLSNAGDAVAISWRLLGERIAPVRLTVTPVLFGDEAISSEIFNFEPEQDGGRLIWMPFRRASKIIADTNGRCMEPPVTIDTQAQENSVAPSAFVFDLGRRPALLLLSAELPTSGAIDPLLGAFLADLADPGREERKLLVAA
jgi:hypothetical protein